MKLPKKKLEKADVSSMSAEELERLFNAVKDEYQRRWQKLHAEEAGLRTRQAELKAGAWFDQAPPF